MEISIIDNELPARPPTCIFEINEMGNKELSCSGLRGRALTLALPRASRMLRPALTLPVPKMKRNYKIIGELQNVFSCNS